MRSGKARSEKAQREAEDWNRDHPIGTKVRFWYGLKEGEPTGVGATKTEAWDAHGTAVVFVEGARGYIALSHVAVAND